MSLLQTPTRRITRACLLLGLVAALLISRDPHPFMHQVAAGEAANTEGKKNAIPLDQELAAVLGKWGFTGRIEEKLEKKLNRKIDNERAQLGNFLFFDKILALGNDNTCSGCHSPTHAFGDTQSIAIGVSNNDKVGVKERTGPRNQRRTPTIINNAFYPKLMWNGRFAALSNDPFSNKDGFEFPLPEGDASNTDDSFFPSKDPHIKHLLVAQAHIPPTELPEMAGFNFERGKSFRFPRFNGDRIEIATPERRVKAAPGQPQAEVLPHPIGGFFNEPIRNRVIQRLNSSKEYRKLFAQCEPAVAKGHQITFEMVGRAIAEFEISMTFANAPIDRFAKGDTAAMTESQKKGALLFFGKARCAECHAVAGKSNEMFSDFNMHVIGMPQIAPLGKDGVGTPQEPGGAVANVPFKGEKFNEDFGLEDISRLNVDRYKFRTSPLRNVGLQPTFGHNGAYTSLDHMVRHHLDPRKYVATYNPVTEGVAEDLTKNTGPTEPVLKWLSPLLDHPIALTDAEIADLVAFVGQALTDDRAKPDWLRANGKVPDKVPSGLPVHNFIWPKK